MNLKLTNKVKKYATDVLGARIVGLASIDRFSEAPVGHRPDDLLPHAKSVVVVGLPLLRSLMNWRGMLSKSEVIPETIVKQRTVMDWRGTPSDLGSEIFHVRRAIESHIYGRCCYETINNELQRITMHMAFFLEEEGYNSLYLPITYGATFHKVPGPIPEFFGPFSHRHAAVAAGLGELGLNNLLITRKYGPRVRLGSVITTAPLMPDPMVEDRICLGLKCNLCIEKCPTKTLQNEIYEFEMAGKSMELARMKKERCDAEGGGGPGCGGTCMKVCPIGIQTRR